MASLKRKRRGKHHAQLKKKSVRTKSVIRTSNKTPRKKRNVVEKKRVMRQVEQRQPQKKRAAKRGKRAPRKRKPSPLKKVRAQLKKAKTQLAATKRKLRQARVERRVKLLKLRAKRRKEVPKLIESLPGLDEYQRRQAILLILATADDSDEYWELVSQIADELELTTYLVASIASPPRGGIFSVPMAA